MTPEERIKRNLMRVLGAGMSSGSISYIEIEDFDSMCEAMRNIMSEAYIDGSNDCHKIMTEIKV